MNGNPASHILIQALFEGSAYAIWLGSCILVRLTLKGDEKLIAYPGGDEDDVEENPMKIRCLIPAGIAF